MSVPPALPWLTQSFDWVWQTSLQASVLVLLVGLVRTVGGRVLSARWQYVLGLLVVLRLAWPSGPASRFSVFNLGRAVRARSEFVALRFGFEPGGVAPSARDCSGAAKDPAPAPRLVHSRVATGARLRSAVDRVDSDATHAASGKRPADLSSRACRETLLPGFGEGRGKPWWRTMAAWIWWLGVLVGMGQLKWSHWKLARWLVRDGRRIEDPGILSVLASCQRRMGVRRKVTMSAAPFLRAPAVLGWRRPMLLLPAGTRASLDEAELSMVFLHELAHIRRYDVLLNWCCLTLGAVYWFNPLIRLALRQLRADQEVACDELVLRRLEREEGQLYGTTLVKLVETFSRDRGCPTLVSVINRKHEIKRRINMIAHFPTTHKRSSLVAVPLAVILIGLTFTRAAEVGTPASAAAQGHQRVPTQTAPAAEASRAHPRAEPEKPQENTDRGVRELKAQLACLDGLLSQCQQAVDTLRWKLDVPSSITRQDDAFKFDSQARHYFDLAVVNAKADYIQQSILVTNLQRLNQEELKRSLEFLKWKSDTSLSPLLTAEDQVEQQLSSLSVDFGPKSPQIRKLTVLKKKIESQIESRIRGVLRALELERTASKAKLDALRAEEERLQQSVATASDKYRPYIRAKRELEALQRVRHALQLRLRQEEVDHLVPAHASSVPK